MSKTKRSVYINMIVYKEGQEAAKNKNPRFAPYRLLSWVLSWFAGYDSIDKN